MSRTITATELRKIAEKISLDRAQADADAFGFATELASMIDAGSYGQRDIDDVREQAERAEARANDLAEQEHHAWDAYNYVSQAEHYEYLAERDDY